MKILVGLDLRPSSQGALHFARWLHATSTRHDERFVVLHVLEHDHLGMVLRYHHLDEVMGGAVATARTALARAEAGALVREPRVVVGTRAEVDLADAVREDGAGLLVIGRMARRESHPVVRLGRVARRLLRHPPAPLVVVPPDLTAGQVGDGPVVALTSLEDDAVPACRFAADLAARLGRRLELVHVMLDPIEVAPYGILGEAMQRTLEEERRTRGEEMGAWCRRHGLSPGSTVVEVGEVVGRAAAHAERARSPLLVVGARQLGKAERFIMPSVGRELASHATVPVAVVPTGSD
jgi:nucleotide-binding universal stress UspA family protein